MKHGSKWLLVQAEDSAVQFHTHTLTAIAVQASQLRLQCSRRMSASVSDYSISCRHVLFKRPLRQMQSYRAQSVMLELTTLNPVLFLTSSLFAFFVDASVQQPQVHTRAVPARIFFPAFFQAQAYGQQGHQQVGPPYQNRIFRSCRYYVSRSTLCKG